jgi:hypothetical protein
MKRMPKTFLRLKGIKNNNVNAPDQVLFFMEKNFK